jgi:hypothetical protein
MILFTIGAHSVERIVIPQSVMVVTKSGDAALLESRVDPCIYAKADSLR